MIFDTHAHYDDEAFDADREALFASFREAGITAIANIGYKKSSIEATHKLADAQDFIYEVLGFHPDETFEMEAEKDTILEWLHGELQREKVIGLGEIGLDYYWPEPDREIQKYWFARQIRLAGEEDLPIVVHSREAAADTMRIMKENHAEKTGGVVHCFSYSVEMAREFVKMGFYIGIGGVLTFKNARKLVEVAREIPLERLILETDCPYLAPVPFRGKRNSSLYLPYVVKKLAEIKEIPEEEVIRVTEQNAATMYRL